MFYVMLFVNLQVQDGSLVLGRDGCLWFADPLIGVGILNALYLAASIIALAMLYRRTDTLFMRTELGTSALIYACLLLIFYVCNGVTITDTGTVAYPPDSKCNLFPSYRSHLPFTFHSRYLGEWGAFGLGPHYTAVILDLQPSVAAARRLSGWHGSPRCVS